MKKFAKRAATASVFALSCVHASACAVFGGGTQSFGDSSTGAAGLGGSDSLSALLGVSEAVASGGIMLVGVAVAYAMAGKWLALRSAAHSKAQSSAASESSVQKVA
jgi:hypothetical protein